MSNPNQFIEFTPHLTYMKSYSSGGTTGGAGGPGGWRGKQASSIPKAE